jgi:site-specific recombinase XerC
MTGKNVWRIVKTYGRMLGVPELKPHDLRHGVAMELLEQNHDVEQVRALLGHQRIDTTQIYTQIRPSQLKRALGFYDEKAARMVGDEGMSREGIVSGFEDDHRLPQTRSEND